MWVKRWLGCWHRTLHSLPLRHVDTMLKLGQFSMIESRPGRSVESGLIKRGKALLSYECSTTHHDCVVGVRRNLCFTLHGL
jgi:hypothetical protein